MEVLINGRRASLGPEEDFDSSNPAHLDPDSYQISKVGDAFEHTMWVLRKCRDLGGDELQMLCALGHDFGKADTDPALMPRHIGHEAKGVPHVKDFCRRFGMGGGVQQAMETVCTGHMMMHKIQELRPKTLIEFLKRNRRGQLGLEGFTVVCQSDHNGRGDAHWGIPYPQKDYLLAAGVALKGVTITPGWPITRIEQEQITVMGRWKKEYHVIQ